MALLRLSHVTLMDLPCDFRGLSMGFYCVPWVSHATSKDVQCWPMGLQLSHGTEMGLTWDSHGTSERLRRVCNVPMGLPLVYWFSLVYCVQCWAMELPWVSMSV